MHFLRFFIFRIKYICSPNIFGKKCCLYPWMARDRFSRRHHTKNCYDCVASVYAKCKNAFIFFIKMAKKKTFILLTCRFIKYTKNYFFLLLPNALVWEAIKKSLYYYIGILEPPPTQQNRFKKFFYDFYLYTYFFILDICPRNAWIIYMQFLIKYNQKNIYRHCSDVFKDRCVKQSERNSSKTDIFHKPTTYEQHV